MSKKLKIGALLATILLQSGVQGVGNVEAPNRKQIVGEADTVESVVKKASAHGLYTLGLQAYRGKEMDYAQAAYEASIKEDPTHGLAYARKAIILMSQNKLKKAEQSFLLSLKYSPDYLFTYYNMACCYALMDKPADAISSLEKCFQSGYNRFDNVPRDSDMKSIRELPKFTNLLKEYSGKKGQETPVSQYLLAASDAKVQILAGLLNSSESDWEPIASLAVVDSSPNIRAMGFSLYSQLSPLPEKLTVLTKGLFDNNGYVNKVAANAMLKCGGDVMPIIDSILKSDFEDAKFYAKQMKSILIDKSK